MSYCNEGFDEDIAAVAVSAVPEVCADDPCNMETTKDNISSSSIPIQMRQYLMDCRNMQATQPPHYQYANMPKPTYYQNAPLNHYRNARPSRYQNGQPTHYQYVQPEQNDQTIDDQYWGDYHFYLSSSESNVSLSVAIYPDLPYAFLYPILKPCLANH